MSDSEYIKKSDVLELITDNYAVGGFEDYNDYSDFFDAVEAIPAADVRPEIRACWRRGEVKGLKLRYKESPLWYCTNCGNMVRYDTTLRTYQKEKKPVYEVHKFCRKCGAIMDGVTDV